LQEAGEQGNREADRRPGQEPDDDGQEGAAPSMM
jgi:hypothetical protein